MYVPGREEQRDKKSPEKEYTREDEEREDRRIPLKKHTALCSISHSDGLDVSGHCSFHVGQEQKAHYECLMQPHPMGLGFVCRRSHLSGLS